MDSIIIPLVLDGIIMVIVGFAAGYYVRQHFAASRSRLAEAESEKLIAEAQAQQKDLLLRAKDEALELRQAAEAELRERRGELSQRERRLQTREEQLEQKLEQAERRNNNLTTREQQIEARGTEIEELRNRQVRELERISGLTRDEAKDIIIGRVEQEVRVDANRRVREVEHEAREDAEVRARKLVALAVQRYAAEHVAETTLSVVPIPSEEMKGRIIGREGRNIRALEAATGVDLIIDDTPDAVTLSGFDPIRREIARLALNKLVVDGRIHPGRIEEIVAKSKQEVENQIRQEGEQAAYEAGLSGIHPEVIKVMGRMRFRTSYGQNQLQHSVEAAHVAAIMAAELGADVNVSRRAAFLHDIGKVLTHEVEGPHHVIGAEYARRFGESPAVCEAIAGHHDHDPDYQSIEAIVVQAADAASGSRPGARRESVDQYVKRLEALEAVANSFEGVERSFAIQAGREVRIVVKPEQVDDLQAVRLARDIVKRIEETLQYPGQVKVTVVRETRAIEYAR